MNDIQRTIDYFKNKPLGGISKSRKKHYENAVSAMEELRQYRQIGTLEECREARERQQVRKVPDIEHFGRCSECDREFNSELLNEYSIEFCPWCGQALDWREED